VIHGSGVKNRCILETRQKIVKYMSVFIYPGEISVNFVKVQVNCAVATVTDHRVKRSATT
jgi:hypothetical protein